MPHKFTLSLCLSVLIPFSLFWSGCWSIASARNSALQLESLFYQPHTTDLQLDTKWWQQAMEQLQKNGITSLYLQWSRHGDVDFLSRQVAKEGPALIPLLLTLCDRYRIKLHLGLYADPDFFTRIKQSPEALQIYLKRLRLLSLAQAEKIQPLARSHPSLAGLYLYEEIDDVNWRGGKRRQILQAHFQQTYRQLHLLFPDKQIAVSTFFTGRMAPRGYADLWKQITGNNDLVVMVQDGAGSGRLSFDDRFLYLDAMNKALSPQHWTVILELFRQDTRSPDFQATTAIMPFTDNYRNRLKNLDIIPPVGFSLRYLIPMPK